MVLKSRSVGLVQFLSVLFSALASCGVALYSILFSRFTSKFTIAVY